MTSPCKWIFIAAAFIPCFGTLSGAEPSEGRWRTAFVKRGFVGAFQDVWLKGPGSVIRSSTPIPFDGTKVKVQVSGGNYQTELEQLSLVKGMDEKGRVEGPRYPILFEGHPTVSFTTGTQAWSDEIAIPIKRGTWYVQDSYRSSKMPYAWDQNGSSCDVKGSEAKESLASTIKSCRVGILTRIDVFTTDTRPGIVCYGDSITHGAGATPNAGMSYPDQLAKILDRPVLKLGVNGDRIPGNVMAIASLQGVDIVLFLMGINDILTGSVKSVSEYAAKVDRIVKGLAAQKLRVLVGTLPPAGGYKQFDENPDLEKLRQEINGWIRTSSGADNVIDFDKALADPAAPSKMKKEFQSDWLHPSDQGYKKMAETAADAVSVSAEKNE
jgi:lysophospholipase L1-like esterase